MLLWKFGTRLTCLTNPLTIMTPRSLLLNNNNNNKITEITTQISVTCYNKTQQAQLLHPLYVPEKYHHLTGILSVAIR